MNILFSNSDFATFLIRLLPVAIVIFSASFHEWAHGYVAYRCGDPTAKMAGRLTLNPLAHIDPLGSVALPLVLSLLNMPVFAFAKPVPVNFSQLNNPERDCVLVSLAGPLCNVAQAIISASIFRILGFIFGYGGGGIVVSIIATVLMLFTYVNLVLAFFNLIPLPPLDGSKVIAPLLPKSWREKYLIYQDYAIFALLFVFYVLPIVLHFNPLSLYLQATAGNLSNLLLGINIL